MESYEYGVRYVGHVAIHRGPMARDEAFEWVEEWEADGGRPGAFVVIRRPIGEWEDVRD